MVAGVCASGKVGVSGGCWIVWNGYGVGCIVGCQVKWVYVGRCMDWGDCVGWGECGVPRWLCVVGVEGCAVSQKLFKQLNSKCRNFSIHPGGVGE